MEKDIDKYQALLRISRAISSNRDAQTLIDSLALLLKEVVRFEYFAIILHDEKRDTLTFNFADIHPLLDESMTWQDGVGVWVAEHQRPYISSIEELRERFPKMAEFRGRKNVQSICTVLLATAQRKLGCMEFLDVRPNAYSEEDGEFIQQVAAQVAIAVDNILNYEAIHASERQLCLERDRLSMLLKVAGSVGSKRDIPDLLESVAHAIGGAFFCDSIFVLIHDPDVGGFLSYDLTAPCPSCPVGRRLIDESPWSRAFLLRERVLISGAELQTVVSFHPEIEPLQRSGLKALCYVPLVGHGTCVGVLVLNYLDQAAFCRENIEILDGVAEQLAIGIENALAYQEILRLKDKIASEKLCLEETIRDENKLGEIIGQSEPLRALLSEVKMVASSDHTTALIIGETGTGKELIARAIHEASQRRNRPLVKLNCAAIPLGLLESEIFGHEKGAFTGAVAQKMGRLELAHHGTLFLDEIGEIPLELQPKLLRAIQEREFERLGGTRIIKVDVRIIAATNRDLKQMVAQHTFRSDLYYRLNVFPLRVPPLRERRDDIPLLVRHFTQKHAQHMRRQIERISSETMQTLCDYAWPGNIRELENLIERSVLLSTGNTLNVPTSELFETGNSEGAAWEQIERLAPRRPVFTEKETILKALRETSGVIAGPSGAARRLGLKRTTLISRIKRLGLDVASISR